MNENENHSSDEWLPGTPPKLREAAEYTKTDLLPTKSKENYESAYNTFVKWKRGQKTKSTSESIILAYFKELSEKYKPSTLWSIFSMLKATLKIKEQIDINNYHTLKAFLKKQSSGFTSKKSNVLSSEDVLKFLNEAPDTEYLATKVALIFGINGACRSNELVNIKLNDITKEGDLLLVNLPITKTKKPRSFVIAKEFTKVVQKYADLRPKSAVTERFFINFQKGKCTSQVIGIHKFSKMPNDIATYLKLENPASYTGHTFRRTSATLLADNGANMTTLKRHGGWKSSNVVEGYIEESIKNKSKISSIISTAVNFPSVGPSESNSETVQPKRLKIETVVSGKENSNTQLSTDIKLNSPAKYEKENSITQLRIDKNPNSPTKNITYTNCTFIINKK